MSLPERKTLPHNIPSWVDSRTAIYFITINCTEQGENQLAIPAIADALFETIRHRQDWGIWWPHLALLMPDPMHALLSFPPSDKRIQVIISKWKEWTAKQLSIYWQRDFFEHRLRRGESRRAKADYILQNPVRKELVTCAADWPFVYCANPN